MQSALCLHIWATISVPSVNMQSTADFSPDWIYSRLSLTSLLIRWLFQEYLLLYQFLWRERRAEPHPSAVCSGPALIELNLSSGHKVTLTHNCQTNALNCQNSVSGKIIHNSSIPLSACITGTCCGFLHGSVFRCCCLDLIKCKRTLILGSVLLFLIYLFSCWLEGVGHAFVGIQNLTPHLFFRDLN